jgi:hypothetical protein
MTRKLATVQGDQAANLQHCIDSLTNALVQAKFAGCPRLADKIRSAIKSAGGAQRHMERRITAACDAAYSSACMPTPPQYLRCNHCDGSIRIDGAESVSRGDGEHIRCPECRRWNTL